MRIRVSFLLSVKSYIPATSNKKNLLLIRFSRSKGCSWSTRQKAEGIPEKIPPQQAKKIKKSKIDNYLHAGNRIPIASYQST